VVHTNGNPPTCVSLILEMAGRGIKKGQLPQYIVAEVRVHGGPLLLLASQRILG
jgi:hypothetical protein